MNIFIQFALITYFLPLAAFVVNIMFGKRLPRQGDWVSIGAVGVSLILSVTMFAGMLLDYNPDFKVEAFWRWIHLGAFNIDLGFLIDNITVTMLLVVALVSTMSHIFSIKYMEGDPLYYRYYAFLSGICLSISKVLNMFIISKVSKQYLN